MIILGTNSIKDTGFNVANSLRFNDGSSDNLSRSTGTPSSRQKFTFSTWIKLSSVSGNRSIFNIETDGNTTLFFMVKNGDQLHFVDYNSGAEQAKLTTNALHRDPSAWYHVVLRLDSTQGTNTDRCRLYVNGSEVTSFSATVYPSQNYNFTNNVGNTRIGVSQGDANYWDGYMAETVYCDNQSLDPTSFGEFDEDSPTIWKPIDVSGLTFGNEGFYLDFENASSLGADVSGNGNNFTVNNLTSIDQSTDTCTNNFATLNPLVNFNSGVFSEGNCAITYGDDTISTIGVTKGRWYWEAQRTNTATEAHFGIGLSKGFYSATSIVSDGDRLYTRSGATYFSAVSNLSILTFGSNSGTSAAVGNGDVISFYLDLESSTKNITIKKNDGATPIVNVDLTYSGAEPIFAFCRMNSGCSSSWNFGNPIAALSSANSDPNGYGSFEYSTTLNSVDYYALCTKNLAEYG